MTNESSLIVVPVVVVVPIVVLIRVTEDKDYDKDRDYDKDYDKDEDYDKDYDKDEDYDWDRGWDKGKDEDYDEDYAAIAFCSYQRWSLESRSSKERLRVESGAQGSSEASPGRSARSCSLTRKRAARSPKEVSL